MNQDAILQALVRFGRTVGAAAISAALLAVGDLVIDLQLGPTLGPIVLLVLTAALNAIGKLIRGPDVPIATFAEGRIRGTAPVIRSRPRAFFLPI